MGIGLAGALAGEWELAVDLPGAGDARGRVLFEAMGEVLIQRTTAPGPVPDSWCLVIGEAGTSSTTLTPAASRGCTP
jgi:hypothetical protein